MVRITEEILEKMREMRRAGATYDEIQKALNISKWACINYLRGIKTTKSAVEKAWRKAENEAFEYLTSKGFEELHDLNKICPSPYWDILGKKKGECWLIDVTISEGKRIGAKIPYFVDGYVHAVLYRNINDKKWKLVKLSYEEVE